MDRAGRIVTFYSFKGGVGRTMALANVAFLAARNGARVLVMDWDLEAPGVPYYFRGQLEPSDEAALTNRPGVLDLLAQWVERARSIRSLTDVDLLVEGYDNDAFEAFVSPLVPRERLEGGQLDVITAGAAKGLDEGRTTYEKTLSDFSWPEFFQQLAGGLVIDALRKWAKRNYDLVLVDSRTGMADVAGICTLQLPDVVAMCFILNRQNVEGTAKVAAAIRRQRGDAVERRLLPMRLARENTAEEADAQAFARDVLRRTGVLDRDRVDGDLRRLGVRSADGVPFYETLSSFVATDPRKDPLTLNYAALAEALTGRESVVSLIDPSWRDSVRRRLEPRQATLAYLAELELADPRRARDELHELIVSASHFAEAGRPVEPQYVEALAKAAFGVAERILYEDEDDEPDDTVDRIIALMRRLLERRPDTWRVPLADLLERLLLGEITPAVPVDEIALREEVDLLLGEEPETPVVVQRRVSNRQRLARSLHLLGNTEEALLSLDLADRLLEAWHTMIPEAAHAAAAVQGLVIRGDIELPNDPGKAATRYERALAIVGDAAEERRTRGDVLMRLTRAYLASEPQRAAGPALELVASYTGVPHAVGIFPTIVDAVLASKDPVGAASTVARTFFNAVDEVGPARGQFTLRRFIGLSGAARFTVAAARMAEILRWSDPKILPGLISAVVQLWPSVPVNFFRRSTVDPEQVQASLEQLTEIAAGLGREDLVERLRNLEMQLTRSAAKGDDEGERDATA